MKTALSGSFTACGKAIVSTPYWYAEELLQNEKGVIVPFNDPESMGSAIADLLLDVNKLPIRAGMIRFINQMPAEISHGRTSANCILIFSKKLLKNLKLQNVFLLLLL